MSVRERERERGKASAREGMRMRAVLNQFPLSRTKILQTSAASTITTKTTATTATTNTTTTTRTTTTSVTTKKGPSSVDDFDQNLVRIFSPKFF